MHLFGSKAPCSHCGAEVHKHHDPDDFLCPHCHQPGPWARPEQAEAFEEAQQARSRYAELLAALAAGTADDAARSELASVATRTGYAAKDLQAMNLDAWRSYATAAIADDAISEAEDAYLDAFAPALGLTMEQVRASFPDLVEHVAIAEINGGQLPDITPAVLIPKRGEVVHAEVAAALLKEVTLREFRGGYQGFSLPVGKTGIRYRVGGARGKSVVVGTQMQVADQGTLCVSSTRAVFVGASKTIEMPYAKLVSLTVFDDGVRFHQSNRVNAPLFRVASGHIVAALINAAAQRSS